MSLDDESPDELNEWFSERPLDLHPDPLMLPELILKVTTDRDRPDVEDITDTIHDLMASGLLQCIDSHA